MKPRVYPLIYTQKQWKRQKPVLRSNTGFCLFLFRGQGRQGGWAQFAACAGAEVRRCAVEPLCRLPDCELATENKPDGRLHNGGAEYRSAVVPEQAANCTGHGWPPGPTALAMVGIGEGA